MGVGGVCPAVCFKGDCDAALFLAVAAGAEYVGLLFSSWAIGRRGECEWCSSEPVVPVPAAAASSSYVDQGEGAAAAVVAPRRLFLASADDDDGPEPL